MSSTSGSSSDAKSETKTFELKRPLSLSVRTVMIMRHILRDLFGSEKYDKCGYFLDLSMSNIVNDYLNRVTYLEGNHVLELNRRVGLACVVTKDGRYLFTSGKQDSIMQWDLTTNTLFHQWRAVVFTFVRCIDYCDRTGLLVSGADDTIVKVWDTSTYKRTHFFKGHSRIISAVKFDAKGERVLSSSEDGTIRINSIKSGECLKVLRGHSHYIRTAVFVHGGDQIVSGSWDEKILVWDSNTGTVTDTILDGLYQKVTCVCFNCDRTLLAGLGYQKIVLFKWPEITKVSEISEWCVSGAFHPYRQNVLAVGTSDGVIIYDVNDGSSLMSSGMVYGGLVSDLCFTPNAEKLVIIADDKCAYLWDVSELL